jgi:hypothetical protein
MEEAKAQIGLYRQEYGHSLLIASALSNIRETPLGKYMEAKENGVRLLLSKHSLLACSSQTLISISR